MRRERKKSYGSATAFLDMMLNVLAVFVFLFVVALTQVKDKEESKEKSTEIKAEFIITVIWPDNLDDDIDTYVQDPTGKLVSFRRREDGLMHLDRDDLGHSNDKIQTPVGIVEYKENREIVTIRGIIPGEYTVNIHAFAKRAPGTTPVTVRLEKINKFKLITQSEVVIDTHWQEKTAFRFTVNADGDVIEVNDLEKKLAGSGLDYPDYSSTPEGLEGTVQPEQP